MRDTVTTNKYLASALLYAIQGWRVFPCRTRGKEPLTPHGYKDATTNEQTIRGWWTKWPTANVAIACGATSSIVVLDIDPRNGGEDSLSALIAQQGRLPDTVEALTGGGGRHIYFRHPGGTIKNAAALGGWAGLDVKADGGYVIAPPSLHPNGICYEWELSSEPPGTALVDVPAWLLRLMRPPTTSPNGHEAKPIGEKIPKGQQHRTLVSLAGTMRRRGMNADEIEAALLVTNANRLEEPAPPEDIKKIARSVSNLYEPSPEEANGHETDDDALQKDYGHATVLARLFRDKYRWAVHSGHWMRFDGRVWQPVPEEAVAKEAADVLRREYAAQLAANTDKHAIQDISKKVAEICTYARIIGALAFLKGWPHVLTLAEQWDRDPYLLNVGSGTLDLRTCNLRPHDPDDLITKMAPVDYDPTAKSDRWEQHVTKFLPNPNIRRQVQRDLGLALVGAPLEETLPIWHGTGANGKTTTSRVLLQVLGAYGGRAAPNLLIQSKNERHPTEIADLCGKRLVFSAEVDQGKHLAEALVKDLTGGDRKNARFMHKDFFQFEQTFSIVLIVNHKPIVTGDDTGIWRRIRLIPWEYRIPDSEKRPQDEVLAELAAEGSAILNWLLEGLRDWQRDHHWTASEVQVANDAYRAEMDVLADFIADGCVLGPRCTVPKGELFAAYERWCERSGERPLAQVTFTKRLEGRGVGEVRKHGGVRHYTGIGLVAGR